MHSHERLLVHVFLLMIKNIFLFLLPCFLFLKTCNIQNMLQFSLANYVEPFLQCVSFSTGRQARDINYSEKSL